MIRSTLIAAALATTLAAPALAQSTDFSTWTASGDVLRSTAGAQLSTAATESGETSLFGGSALLYYDLEALMGTSFAGDTFEGSGISTSFSTAAGTKVSVNWSLSTTGFDSAYVDRAYVVIDGTALSLAEVAGSTQVGSFSHTFATAGSHTLGFALLDVNDVLGVSSLTVSGLTVTAAVPEPAGYALMLAGLAGVGLVARRRR